MTERLRQVVRVKDGKEYVISVKRVTHDLIEPVVQLMSKYFTPRENMNIQLGFASDVESCKSLEDSWRKVLSMGEGLVALLDNSTEGSSPIVVGANVTYLMDKEEEDYEVEKAGKTFRLIGQILKQFDEAVNICEHFGVDSYLTAMGLCVDPAYSGLGIGLELLKGREALCKELGVSASATVFTSPVSQHLASKAGFQTLYSIPYTSVRVGDLAPFPLAEPDHQLKLMARTYT